MGYNRGMKRLFFTAISAVLPALFIVVIATITGTKVNSVEVRGAKDQTLTTRKIDRVLALEMFLEKYKSPLKPHAKTFVEVADQYELDYKLLPAISCIESTCGKFLPDNSYNPFGWGVYGTQAVRFKDFDEAIVTVGEGLNENYFSKGFDTPAEIAPIYTPPNSAKWLSAVNYFVEEMNKVERTL